MFQPACAAKCKGVFPSLSDLSTSIPGKCKNSSKKLVRLVEHT